MAINPTQHPTSIRLFCCLLVLLLMTALCPQAIFANAYNDAPHAAYAHSLELSLEGESQIKWAELNVSSSILKDVYGLSIKYHKDKTIDFDFVKALAYLATKNGNRFVYSADKKALDRLVEQLSEGKTIEQLTQSNKYYEYYHACFDAVFSGFVGEYTIENDQESQVYFGLKAYFPLARGYWFSHYDDFGTNRSYGFRRVHLGHDIFGSVGTPVVAIEGGIVEEMGWNQYGGWRIGIRSFDKKRYYYYAHLRKGHPFALGIKCGDAIRSGTVIGYLGKTGYSATKDTDLKTGKPHLHLGLQLIFDQGERERTNEIWVDLYALTDFLLINRAQTQRVNKDYASKNLRLPIRY